jgi:hypothetical protein
MTGIPCAPSLFNLLLLVASMLGIELAEAAVRCERNLVANVVALDQPLMFNRLGAQNVNGMMFAAMWSMTTRCPWPRAGRQCRAKYRCDPTSVRAHWCCVSPPVIA